jgi:hypothetical protein
MGTRPPNNNAIRVPLRETAVAALLVDVRPSIQPVPDGDSPRSRNRFDKVGHRLATCHWMGRGRSQGQTGSTPCHQMHRETVCRSRRLYLRRAFSRSNLALSRTPLDLPLTSPPTMGAANDFQLRIVPGCIVRSGSSIRKHSLRELRLPRNPSTRSTMG